MLFDLETTELAGTQVSRSSICLCCLVNTKQLTADDGSKPDTAGLSNVPGEGSGKIGTCIQQ